MFLSLHKLTIKLDSPSRRLRREWQRLFAGWLREEATQVNGRLRLRYRDRLPPLPDERPFFSDSQHLQNGVGILSVYRGEKNHVWLHYLDGALVKVPLGPVQEATTIEGDVIAKALQYGRFEDVTFTSLAPLLRRHGYYLLHAFAAEKDGRAILIVGPSGSGKTTSGLSLLLSGWRLLANDIVILERRQAGIFALPTPSGVSIRPYTLKLLPRLKTVLRNVPLTGRTYNVTGEQLVNGRWGRPSPVHAIYFPHILEQPHHDVASESSAFTLAHLMTESIDRWDPDYLPAHMALLEQLSQQAPAYQLYLGTAVHRLATLIGEEMTALAQRE